MSIVSWYFYNVIATAKLFASLVEDNTILVKVLSLANDWNTLSWSLSGIASLELTCTCSSIRMCIERIITWSCSHPLWSATDAWQRLIVSITLSLCSSHQESCAWLSITKFIWEFTDIGTDFLDLFEFFSPFSHTVGWLFILQPPQNCLIFNCYFHEILLSLLSI